MEIRLLLLLDRHAYRRMTSYVTPDVPSLRMALLMSGAGHEIMTGGVSAMGSAWSSSSSSDQRKRQQRELHGLFRLDPYLIIDFKLNIV